MSKYVILWKYTQQGLAAVNASPDRAEAFKAAAQKMGVKVDTFLWTAGPHDGLAIADAPDDETMSAVVLSLGKLGNVSTTTMRAFDAAEFRKVLGKVK